MSILEQLLESATATENPRSRRWFLEEVLTEFTEQDSLLPDWLIDEAATKARWFRSRR